MSDERELVVKNKGRERLPCKLSADEWKNAVLRRSALERDLEDLNAKVETIKAKAKADADKVRDEIAKVSGQHRELREAVEAETEIRNTEVEYCYDPIDKRMYAFRVDLEQIVRGRPATAVEINDYEQGLDRHRARVDAVIHPGVEEVERFDNDPPGTGTLGIPEPDHQHTFNEGKCETCGEVDPDYDEGGDDETETEEAKPQRRKKGSGKKKTPAFDTRGAEGDGAGAH